MTERIKSWLNDEVQLTKKIKSLEKDFSNGFFFGELLQKYNQQLNFSEFVNMDTKNAIVHNFSLLFQTFNNLGVKMDTNVANNIIQKKPNESEKVLLQLKMSLENVIHPGESLANQRQTQYNSSIPSKILKPPKLAYDDFQSKNFKERLNKILPSQKIIDEQKKLDKFPQFKLNQEQKAYVQENRKQKEEKDLKEEFRKIQVNKVIRVKEFSQDFQKKGNEDWKKNINIKNQREYKDKMFKETQEKQKLQKLTLRKSQQQVDVMNDIQKFDENLKMKGIVNYEDSDSEQNANEVKTTVNKQKVNNMKYIEKKKSELTNNEKDKRRRKMIVEQNKMQKQIEVARREQLVLQKLKQQSKQEKEIEYEIWKVYQCKEIIQQNRIIRDQRYKEKEQLTIVQKNEHEKQMFQQLNDQFKNDVQSQQQRYNELQIEVKQEKRKENYDKCWKITEQLLDLAELIYSQQQKTDSNEIQINYFKEQAQLFIEDQTFIKQKNTRHFNVMKQLKNIEENYEIQKEILNKKEMELYIKGQGRWQPTFQVEQQEKTIEENDKFLIEKPINNFYFGDIMRYIIEQNFKDKQLENDLSVSNYIDPFISFKGCIQGYQFTSKNTIASVLAKQYGLQVIRVEDIIGELLHYYNTQENAESLSSEQKILSRQIYQELIKGKQLEDEMYISAIKFKLQNLFPYQTEQEFLTKLRNNELQQNGFIIVGFPNNYNQAKLLDRELANFVCNDEKPKNLVTKQLENLNQVCQYTPDIIEQRKPIKCLFDQMFLIHIQNQESIRRAFGRRIDEENNIIYHLEDNPPTFDKSPLNENLQQIRTHLDNEMIMVDRNTYLDDQVEDLKQWYSNQGVKNEQPQVLEQRNDQEQEQQEEKAEEQADDQQIQEQNQEEQVKQEIPEQVEQQEQQILEEQQQKEENIEIEDQAQEEQEQQEVQEEIEQENNVNIQNQDQEELSQQEESLYIDTLQVIDGHKGLVEIKDQIDKQIQRIMQVRNVVFDNINKKEQLQQQQKKQQEKERQIQEENDKK